MTTAERPSPPPRPPRPCPHPAQERTLARLHGGLVEVCRVCGEELGRAARPAQTDVTTTGEGD